MIFSNIEVITNVDATIIGVNMDRVECTKFPGVLIDNKLTWKEHMTKLKGKTIQKGGNFI